MYLKWQGQFWSSGCSSASSASRGAAECTLCCWAQGCATALSAQWGEGGALAGGTEVPCWLTGLAGENGRSMLRHGRRQLDARPSFCTQNKCISGALYQKSSITIPFPCCLLLWQLARSLCHSPGFCWAFSRPVWAVPFHWRLMSFYLLPWTHFYGDLLLRLDCALLSSYRCSCCKQ